VLSARASETDKVRALEAGAVDYLVKPFGSAELLARARVHLWRHQQAAGGDDALLSFGDVALDRAHSRVTRAGKVVHLTPIEYRPGFADGTTRPGIDPPGHRHLLQELWGPSHADDAHHLRVHMGNLRKKVEHDPSRPRWLVTEIGIGYRFVSEDR